MTNQVHALIAILEHCVRDVGSFSVNIAFSMFFLAMVNVTDRKSSG